MNRLVLVPCVLVIAFYVAFASYLAWPTIVYQHGRSRAALDALTSVANPGEIRTDRSSFKKQTDPVLAAHEAPTKQAAPDARSDPAVLPEYHSLAWVTVLLPAKVHAGPSVEAPIIRFYAVGTPLNATRYSNDWIEVNEPGTSTSGWIYRKYLGAISNIEQGKIASQEVQEKSPVAGPDSAKRYSKDVPGQRSSTTTRFSKQSTRVNQVAARSIHGRTEMANLLQRAFSGY